MVPPFNFVCFWALSLVTCDAHEGFLVFSLLSSPYPSPVPSFFPIDGFRPLILPLFAPSRRIHQIDSICCLLPCRCLFRPVASILSPNALSEIVQIIQKMSFEIGETVEVIDNEDGMEGSYFRGQMIDRSPGSRTIRYQSLLADDGSPLEEVISVRRLRPPPPTVLARFHLGDMVDAWHNEGWWVGRYVRREGQKYTVFFENNAPANQHVSYPKSQLRVHQEWKELEEGGKWKYVKR
ncbi:hypothetical protein LXL04_022232 [Taraxacum kok-saghyz]